MKEENRTGELLFMKWAGHRLGEPHVLIWGVPASAFGKPVSLHERCFRFAQRETYLNCSRFTDALLDEWIVRINEIRPSLIESYVDAIHELSKRVLRRGAKMSVPKGIITSAGVLTEPARDTISKAFMAPILNRYGSREVGNVACSCPLATQLHVHDGWAHLEIVDEHGNACAPGVEGGILVTLFSNRTMPLIRYRIEDRGVWAASPCACGRQTRLLERITGRANDYLVAADGTRISSVALTTYTALSALTSAADVRAFQYRQTQRGLVTLTVAPMPGADRNTLNKALEESLVRIRELLKGVRVELQVEDEILPSYSGKYRFIINEIEDGT